MYSLIAKIHRWLVAFRKTAGRMVDVFQPQGHVEARLIWASGPLKGQIYKVFKGRNVVTGWLSAGGVAPTSGRDMMRRILIPVTFPAESLAADDAATITSMQLGSGTTAETSNDTELANLIVGSDKTISAVTLDALSPYVTFIAEWSEGEVNQTISEAALISGRGDFVARKTFGSFTKTSEFTLQILWQVRF